VTIGIMSYEPYTVDDGGEITGPVPEVARAVLGQLGITDIKIVLLHEEAQLLVGLRAGQFDLAGGLAVRPDLCTDLAFSTPDYVSGTAFIVPAGNPKGLATYADVVAKGAKVAVMKNLPEQGDATTARVPAGQIVPLDVPDLMMQAVRRGQADCAAFDDLSARELVKSTGGALTVAAPFLPPGRLPVVGAYAFPKDKADLLESFDNRLHDLHESGDWLGIVAPFGLTEDHVPPPDLTMEKACAG
jgi:polar amino acid transport system substrate-binding protein